MPRNRWGGAGSRGRGFIVMLMDSKSHMEAYLKYRIRFKIRAGLKRTRRRCGLYLLVAFAVLHML